MSRGAYLLDLGRVPYVEAWGVQRSLAAAVSQGAIPDTVVLLEHPPVITLGRRSEAREVHVPPDAEVEIVETDRGGKSTYHGPGQLVCYPILDLNRHGRDVKRYCRSLEEAVIRTLAAFGLDGTRIDGLTGVWMSGVAPGSSGASLTNEASPRSEDSTRSTDSRRGRRIVPPAASVAGEAGLRPAGAATIRRAGRKVCSIGVHVSRWVTTHGYALNVDLDTQPFTQWITACGLDDAAFTTMARELGRPLTVDEVRPAAARAIGEVFDLRLEELPAEEGAGLWSQPVHEQLATR